MDEAVWWKALLALAVALLLQIGVNYANDYSDGIRGTDDDRVGPLRLVGSGVASPGAVKTAAFAALGAAALVGPGPRRHDRVVAGRRRAAVHPGRLVLHRRQAPYGYLGLGEVMVFVFFGLVAVLGTTYVQTESFELPALYAAVGVGAFACAILVANNLRDIPTDEVAGKRTLAVALGDERTRLLYGLLVGAAVVALVGVAADHHLVGAARAGRRRPRPSARSRTVLGDKATGPGLIPVLQLTGVAELLYAAGILAGIGVSAGSRRA